MVKKVNTQIIYQENCEYKKSSTKKNINIQPQTVSIKLTLVNENHENLNNQSSQNLPNYFNDILRLEAYVYQTNGSTKDIQKGRIEFSYKPTDSREKRVTLNPEDSCILDKHGRASIKYRPNKNGTFYAKYIDDDGWYQSAEDHINCTLTPIPVTIEFTKKPPYVTSLQDSIELEVEVKKQNDENDILNYGVVTFLHYSKHFDMEQENKRVEHVIGNPVLVKDGKASIKYIPIQEYSGTDIDEETLLEDGIEYIRAVYNYNNDIYFQNKEDAWEYYGSANVYTNVEIYKPNSITIGLKNVETDADGIYNFKERSYITIQASLFDSDGNEIILEDEDTKDLTFTITGTYITLKKDYLLTTGDEIVNLNDIDDTISEHIQYNQYTYEYEYNIKDTDSPAKKIEYEIVTDSNGQRHGYFYKQIRNLRPGFYTIQASTNGQIIDGEIKLYPTSDAPVTTNKYTKAVKYSNILYIRSEFTDTHYHTLTTTLSNNNCNNNIIQNNNIIYTGDNIQCALKVAITAQDSNNSNQDTLSLIDTFDRKKCYFHCANNNTVYEGTLNRNGDTLIGTPDSNIIFDTAGDYRIYAYLPIGYYTNGDENSLYKTIFMQYKQSNTLMVYVRDRLRVNIDIEYPNRYTYTTINYTITAPFTSLGNNQNVNINLFRNNVSIDNTRTHLFNQSHNSYTGQFSNLLPGDYRLEATSTNDNVTTVKEFTILTDLLKISLPTASTAINANPLSTLEVVLSSNNDNMGLLQKTNNKINKLAFYIQDKVNYQNHPEQKINITDYEILTESDKNIKFILHPNIYVADEWYIWAEYEGDEYFRERITPIKEFTTSRIKPQITIQNTSATSMDIIFDNNIGVIGEIKYFNNNTLLSSSPATKNIFLTNEQGICSVNNIPSTCNKIVISINPNDADLMSIFAQNNYASTLNSSFNVIKEKSTDINRIKTQYDNSNGACLFPLYLSTTKNVSRNIY